MDELAIGDKKYISTKRAAEVTGYAKDYVGQLCREGRVEARLVGRSWYVLDSAITEHRFGKEAQEPKNTPINKVEEQYKSWEAPKYSTEIPYSLPILKDRPVRSTLNLLDTSSKEKQSDISSNQAVFEEAELLEEVIPDTATPLTHDKEITQVRQVEVDETEIPLHKLTKRSTGGQFDVRTAHKSEIQPERRTATPRRNKKSIVPAILIACAILAIVIMLLGTGAVDGNVPESIFIDFLGGKSTYIKQ